MNLKRKLGVAAIGLLAGSLMVAGCQAQSDDNLRVQTFHVPLVTSDIKVVNNRGRSTVEVQAQTGDIFTTGGLEVGGSAAVTGDLTVAGALSCKSFKFNNALDVTTSTTLHGLVCLHDGAILDERILPNSVGKNKNLLFSLMLPESRVMGCVDIIFMADIFNEDGVTLYHPEIFTVRYAFFKLGAGIAPTVNDVSVWPKLVYYYNEFGTFNASKSYAQIATPDETWVPTSRQINFYYQPPTDSHMAKNINVSLEIHYGPAGVSNLWVR